MQEPKGLGVAPGAFPPPLAAGEALLLDFDGTLVDIAPRPDAVIVRRYLPRLLQSLSDGLDGALGIVTGRLLQDVDLRLAPFRFAGAGLHGAQVRRHPEDEAPVGRDERMTWVGRDIATRLRDTAGILIEDKGMAIAVHFRQAPERAEQCRTVVREALEHMPGVEMIEGHCVVEARRRGVNKEAAVDTLCNRAPFEGRAPVVLGDDRTDEDAFRAARRRGGRAIRVGPGETIATARLDDVTAVHGWLRQSLEQLA